MSKHFLFVMWEGGGSAPPELGLARQMVTRGHRVTVLGDDCLRDEAAAAGARFVGFAHAPNRPTKGKEHDPIQDWRFESPIDGIQAAVTTVVCGTALGVARDILTCHARDPVDVVAGCGFLIGAIIGAEKAGIPSVVLFPNIDLRPAKGRPGFGPGLAPMEGPAGAARDEEIWQGARGIFQAGQPSLDEARDALGLPRTTHPWEEYDRASRVVLLTSRHFEYPYELPDRTVIAGPVLDDPAWATGRIERDRGPASEPLVLVSLGSSFQGQLSVYRRVARALAGLSVRGVVTLGNVYEVEDIDAPAQVEVVASAPHGPLLQRAAVFVTHGGHGGVMKSLAAGVPMVVLPLGRDQVENAARVEWHGAGLRLPPTASPEEIAAAVTRVLDDARFSEAAQRLGPAIREEVREGIAVRELEAVAAESLSAVL